MTTATKRLSTRAIARTATFDELDCTKTGYIVTLYSDGHLAAEYRSRWQGSRDGARYVTEPGHIYHGAGAQEALDTWVATYFSAGHDLEADPDWRRVRRGRVVR